ncbi:hypothetical protein [Rhodococcus qingshengii]|uniref:Uncharacterized protein n=1 Tax=Rhodococcus qingshengii TaxID=334542 RepID=A0A2A5IZN2_RHOSG|nr:hypothetical protein [Rhodococcus qingshengii]PCK22790.1 hypothetical protein CHR55_31520 [Rhodococcus qingshengii]
MEKLPPGKPGAQPIAGQFEGGILGWVLNLIGGKIGALIADLAQALLGLGNFADPNMNAIRDGQLDLNHRTDLLSPLLDYGSAYANTQAGIFNKGQVGFTNQIGPMQGCHLANGRIVLDSEGLWDIRCQLWIDYIDVLSGMVEWEIRILNTADQLYSRQRTRLDSQEIFSSTNITTVVVPQPGYQVQIYITEMAPGRGAIGGPTLNRLSVQHISRSTDIGNTGQG